MTIRELEPEPTIIYATPDETEKLIGQRHPYAKLAFTEINKETGKSRIIINSQLPDDIQKVLLEHETVQFRMIQGYSGRGEIENIMPFAHYAGLDAGLDLAIELGVVEEYLKQRGQGETIESIRNAPRP